MRKIFGTDGIRGLANAEPMTPETMLRLALAAGLGPRLLGREGRDARLVRQEEAVRGRRRRGRG